MSIPYTPWPDGALQGNIPVNDSLQALAALGQATVESTTNTPPTTTITDANRMWLVGTAPMGAWAGKANNLALCTAANVWRFFAPGTNAWIAWDKGTSQVKRYDTTAAAWVVWNDQVMRGFKNYLINGDLLINQRVFAGGSLAAGVYGYDRWKAGTGGCNVSVNSSTAVVTHTSGPLVQVIESPRLASAVIFVSVEDPSGSITVNVDGQTGTITSGTGRRGVLITVPSGSTGNITLTLTATGATYKRVQLELGSSATAFEWRPISVEMLMCLRYYEKSYELSVAPGAAAAVSPIIFNYVTNSGFDKRTFMYNSRKRAAPTLTFYSPNSGASAKAYNLSTNADIAVLPISSATASYGTAVTGQAVGNEIQVHYTADAEL